MQKENIQIQFANLYMEESDKKERIGDDYKNLGDRIYESIKRKIICHEIKPKERIVDKHLAEKLGVSRSLVRQALTVLEKEELVTLVPRSGFYVRDISKKDVEEIYDIRNLLETHATKLGVINLKEKDLNFLEKIFEDAKRDLEKNKVKSFIEADAYLHEILINNCGNERLKKMINKYSNHYVFYRLVDLSRVKRAKEAYFEHYEIFLAVKKRDIDLSAHLMSKHIKNAKRIILENFDYYTYHVKTELD